MPPETVKVIEPFAPPLQETGADTVERAKAAGWDIVTEVLVVQPFASVMVTVYVPTNKLLRSCESLSGFSGPSLLQSYV